MAWTYSDWEQESTTAAKITRGRLFLQELLDAIGPNVGADGKNRDSGPLVEMYDKTAARIAEYEKLASAATNGGVSLARFRPN